ncbi:glycoside hydrolase family 5 protein [Nocardioides speluncae]|uniref:glycoside hydrolase family 5 protein n=1 Tax=Nocardioides speluncae TaxID=2670337 RepID=UPI000D6855BB|nr:cellulase family glycosylhydrolase [Nocardioides speluncae]
MRSRWLFSGAAGAFGAAVLVVSLTAPAPAGGAPPSAAPAIPAAAVPSSLAALTGQQLAASWTPPLSTRGRYVVDANGNRFKLKSANWEGAQGRWEGSGDINDPNTHRDRTPSYNIPLGLDRVPMTRLLADFRGLGLNSIRLPYSNEMLHMTVPVPDHAVAANPALKGKTPLQVFDAVVAALTDGGFAVILNDHTTTARWCCGLDGNERWNSSQSAEQWIADWVMLTNRYKSNKRVVGMDLRNEVRRDFWNDPNWTWGNDHDLFKAYQQAGLAIQKANPAVLLILEGINWVGIPSDLFFHERPHLKPVANLSHTFPRTDKVVYAAHFYGYTGSNHTGATGSGETHDWRYRGLSVADLRAAVDREALFVHGGNQHYTAPVWISEFGTGGVFNNDGQERAWWGNFTDILIDHDVDFAFWPLVGRAENGDPVNDWNLLSYEPDGTKIGIDDPRDWRYAGWQKLMNTPSKTGPVTKPARWNMLNLDYEDYQASATMRGQGDWDSGARKGSCPDSQRLMGLSRSNSRGLCTDRTMPSLAGPRVVVTDERYVTTDWASGYNKLQCPDRHLAVGYSVRSNAMSALVCAQTTASLPTDGRNVWFDHSDNRPPGGGSTGSDWAPGYYKGQCADDEYVAGVAYTWRWNHGGVPDALLCRRLS